MIADADAVIGFVLAVLGGTGVYCLYSAAVIGRVRLRGGIGGRRRGRLRAWTTTMGLDRVRPTELIAVTAVLGSLGAIAGRSIFGGSWAAVTMGLSAALIPVVSSRTRHRMRLEQARDAWPRMIEQIRLQIVSLGRSVPQALLDVGLRAPDMMRPAFDDARREWSMSTDLDRTLEVLKAGLAEPTADAVCETLLIAHETGGTDVDARLRDLLEDRIVDVQGRRDARARQAGVRFARLFVLLVPLGMALVGLGIGEGRAAYATSGGQAAIVVAFVLMGGCWWWAGRLLRLPDERRVFTALPGGEQP
jgi:tight adherence protein B